MDKIDFERLRSDLIDYYGTAIASGFKVAIIDISRVESAPFNELIAIATECNFDLNNYLVKTR